MEPVHPQRPSTWTRYREGLCESCRGLCCSLPLDADHDDMIQLGLVTPDDLEFDLKGTVKRLRKSGLIQDYRARDGIFRIAQKQHDTLEVCVFLTREGRCSVYERRPRVCRQFPKIGPRPGACPYQKKLSKS